jgi:2-amino-4-hydroxy-6-hydroxymethyldihydropteridine diphosphokinase
MTSTPVTAYIGLGSNLGRRGAAIDAAIAKLASTNEVEVTAVSSVIESAPVGPPGQGMYLNAVMAISTTLDPFALLDLCHGIEADHGRRRDREERWGPRPLDLDVLLFGDAVINSSKLTIPHPSMHRRPFVLGPLAEIAPRAVHPVFGVTIEDLSTRAMGDGELEYAMPEVCFPPRGSDARPPAT